MSHRTIPVVLAATLLASCGSKGESPPAAPMGESAAASQAQFEEARAAAEAARRAYQELQQRRRSFVRVEFDGFDEQGRIRVALTNVGSKAIDNIRGSVLAEDLEGQNLASSGLTLAVPGDIFLTAGQTHKRPAFVTPKPDLAARLREQPASVRFWFEALEIIYADGSKEPGLDL